MPMVISLMEINVNTVLAAGGDPTSCAGYNLVEKIYNNESMNNLIAYIWIKSLCLG